MTLKITKTGESERRGTRAYIQVALGVLTVFTFLFGLTIPLVGPDEPRYAQVAREMFDRGDWVTPTLGGFTWFEKPALLYWLEMTSYHLFGVNEFAARFGSAIFGLGTVASLWILGRGLTGSSREKIDFAFHIALIAASTLGIIVFSRGASFDIVITFPLTAALVSFFVWHSKNEIGSEDGAGRVGVSLPLLLFYVFIGVALLAKGLIGIVFPFAIVVFYYVLSRRLPSLTFILSLFWGTLLAVAVAAIWYLPVYLQNGYTFVDEFFIQHHFQRFTSNKFQHPQGFHFFFWVLPLMTLPWLPFFLVAIWSGLQKVFQSKEADGQEAGLRNTRALILFAFSWLLVPLVFFSFSGSKLPGYILPSVPAAIILTALYLSGLVQKRKGWGVTIPLIAAAVFLATTVALVTVVPRFADTDSVKALIQKAGDRGYSNETILSLHTVSHNAEFYGAGRLLRDETGKQKRLYGPAEVLAEIERENRRKVLVLVPLEYLVQVTSNEKLSAEVIADNGELAILEVSAR